MKDLTLEVCIEEGGEGVGETESLRKELKKFTTGEGRRETAVKWIGSIKIPSIWREL